jgi:NADH:ubiquinone oxidoreductase subunit 4 (subunit M)
VLALWGVVISTVYMLRAYRKTFMGTPNEKWKEVVDLRPALRLPVALLVGALLCYGFFPQFLVRMVAPKFRAYLSANRSHLIDEQGCSHGTVRRPHAVTPDEGNAPPGRGYNICEIACR